MMDNKTRERNFGRNSTDGDSSMGVISRNDRIVTASFWTKSMTWSANLCFRCMARPVLPPSVVGQRRSSVSAIVHGAG
jgi:hypothetical protein